MDSNLNQLAPITDFENAYILAQQAHELGFRGSTFPELYTWLKGKLDLTGLSNTAGLPEDFPIPGSTLAASNPQEWTILGPGTYNKIVSGNITIAEDEFAFGQFDGIDFNRILRIKVPEPNISNLATKTEFQTVAPVAQMLVNSDQLLDNSTFKFGRWNEDGSIVNTSNELRSELIPIDASKGNLTFSGGTAFSTAGARFVFKNDAEELLGFSDNNTAAIPFGAIKVGVTIAYNTSMGSDPTNTIYKSTAMLNYGAVALPWEEFKTTIDGRYISGLSTDNIDGFNEAIEQESTLVVDQKIKPIKQDVEFLLNGYEKFTRFNGVNGEVSIDQAVLNVDGDFIEWKSRPAFDFTSNQLYGLFGTRGISQSNVIGYYPKSGGVVDEIGIRENISGTAPWIIFDGIGDLKGDFHKFKLIVNGSNWDLYVDDILKSSKPKTNSLIINNIGYAYAATFAKIDLKEVIIDTASQYFISDSVENLEGATSGVSAFYEKNEQEKTELSSFYVSYETTGLNPVNTPLFGKFIVYCKRIGKENSYTGIEVWHEVNLDDKVWVDYWRIGFAEEYTFNGLAMVRTHQKVLSVGENENVWKRQDGEYQKADFTGGWHGDEIMKGDGFKMLIDGQIVDLSTPFNLKPATSVQYSINSDMTEVANIIDDVITPVPGHPVDCEHYKRTEFKEGGYKTFNRLTWARAVPVKAWDFGICCFGRINGSQGFNDLGDFTVFPVNDGNMHLVRQNGSRVDYQNPTTGLSGSVEAKILKPNSSAYYVVLEVQSRANDNKYYLVLRQNVTTTTGEVWESEMEVTFK